MKWTDLLSTGIRMTYSEAKEEGYITIEEIMEEMKLSYGHTRQILKKAIASGKVLKVRCNNTNGANCAMYKLL